MSVTVRLNTLAKCGEDSPFFLRAVAVFLCFLAAMSALTAVAQGIAWTNGDERLSTAAFEFMQAIGWFYAAATFERLRAYESALRKVTR